MTLSDLFLQPGIRWMQKMRLAAKFGVICICLLVPLGMSVFGLTKYSSDGARQLAAAA